MTVIYCVKCKEFTGTKAEKLVTTSNGRYRLAGTCSVCGTKKGMFTNKSGKFSKHTEEERDEAKVIKMARSLDRKAKDIGYKVMNNKDATECVKKYISNIRWPALNTD